MNVCVCVFVCLCVSIYTVASTKEITQLTLNTPTHTDILPDYVTDDTSDTRTYIGIRLTHLTNMREREREREIERQTGLTTFCLYFFLSHVALFNKSSLSTSHCNSDILPVLMW